MSDNKPIVLHIGNGYFAPWRGNVPTQNPSEAMQFASDADADAWAIQNGYMQAAECRLYLPQNELLPPQFQKGN